MSKIFVANWKQSGKREEVLAWIDVCTQEKTLFTDLKKVIVCPPLKALDLIAQRIHEQSLPISVGIQDIPANEFEGEKHTGSQSPQLLSDCATYVIIGHSETRQDYNLTDKDVADKILLAKKYRLTPIICISEISQVSILKDLLQTYDGIIAYEPLFAIGTGNAANPKDTSDIATAIKEIFPEATVLYGGSVDASNIKSFTEEKNIDGVLVGNRSLNASFFLEIIKNA